MKFITREGNAITVDPLSQHSIDAAKAAAPGQGIGPAVAGELFNQIADGAVTSAAQLPDEYRHLAGFVGLAG